MRIAQKFSGCTQRSADILQLEQVIVKHRTGLELHPCSASNLLCVYFRKVVRNFLKTLINLTEIRHVSLARDGISIFFEE